MRTLIVGAGAVGGYFGGRLAQAGRDVTLLVRPKRAEQIQAKGLRILSPLELVNKPPRMSPAASPSSHPCDACRLPLE